MTCEVRDQWLWIPLGTGLGWPGLRSGPLCSTPGRTFILSNCLAQALLGPFYTQNNKILLAACWWEHEVIFSISTETLSLRLSLSLSLSKSKSSWNKLHFRPFTNILMTWVFLWILWDCQNVDGIGVIISSSLAARQQPAFSRWYLQGLHSLLCSSPRVSVLMSLRGFWEPGRATRLSQPPSFQSSRWCIRLSKQAERLQDTSEFGPSWT